MLDIHLSRRDDLYAHLRRMVEDGAEDGPARVFYDGAHCLNVRSIHAAALRIVAEEPYCRVVAWTPHHKAMPGPRIAALLAERAARREAKKAAQP